MWGFFAGCLALLAVALGFVLYPWWVAPRPRSESMQEILTQAYRMRREELQKDVEVGWLSPELFSEAESELDRSLLTDVQEMDDFTPGLSPASRRMVLPLAIGMVVLSITLMLASSELTRLVIFGDEPDRDEQTRLLQERLQDQVEQTPEDANAWAELGNFYRRQGRAAEAAQAWTQANALLDYGDASALVSLADALAAENDDWFSDQAVDYLLQALTMRPNHQKALWLAGWAAWQREQPETAHQYWEHLLSVLGPEEEGVRAMVEGWLAEARAEAGMPTEKPSINVSVNLAPELQDAYPADATLFVYARRVSGPPMPLAVWRGELDLLPMKILLDDSMAMVPEMNLSQADEVVVVARISASGLAERQSGDLIGETAPVAVAANAEAAVTISERIP